MKMLSIMKKLGLNLTNGVSCLIKVEDIEKLSGKRIVGNGSTIRRDIKPWSFFNMEINKSKSSVIGFTFDGYKTRRELIGELDHQIKSSKKRIVLEESKSKEREDEKYKLSSSGSLSDKMYSYSDVKKYI